MSNMLPWPIQKGQSAKQSGSQYHVHAKIDRNRLRSLSLDSSPNRKRSEA